MKIKVSYVFWRDVWNYLHSVYRFKWLKHGRSDVRDKLFLSLPVEFQEGLERAKDEKEAKTVIKSFLSKNLAGRKVKYLQIGRDLENVWAKEGLKIEGILQDLYGKKVPFKCIKIYLSSLPRCPHNFEKKWIMVFAGVEAKKQLQIMAHELNHFMYYYYLSDLRSELGNEKYESLKEALTVFTNPEEQGYPAHRLLRAWLARQKGTIPEIVARGNWKRYLS